MVDYLFHVLILIGIFSILGVTFNFVVGYGGIMSLAHAVFFGVGAYTSALLAIHWRLVYPVTLIGGIFLAGLTGAFFIVLLRKLRGDYLIIATLGLQLAVSNVFLNWKSVTHGDVGLVGIPVLNSYGSKLPRRGVTLY